MMLFTVRKAGKSGRQYRIFALSAQLVVQDIREHKSLDWSVSRANGIATAQEIPRPSPS